MYCDLSDTLKEYYNLLLIRYVYDASQYQFSFTTTTQIYFRVYKYSRSI